MHNNRNNYGHVFPDLPVTAAGEKSHANAVVYGFDDILNVSPSLAPLVLVVRKISNSTIPVLLTGESGVGKEVFARAIHQDSNRRHMPFVPVNCGALPDMLVESALFGHERGAFTGAVTRSLGKCREANGGVLFLDEVGELKPDAQTKLLRLLQQGEIEPVGSGKPVRVNLRIICATNRNLEKRVAAGSFREDLYYRMRGLPLCIPPLRERKGDINTLAESFVRELSMSERRSEMRLTASAAACLMGYNWPGNVRELQHVLHRVILLAETHNIEATDIMPWLESQVKQMSTGPEPPSAIQLMEASGKIKTLKQIEQEVINATLLHYNSHVGRTAAALGIGQSTLYSKIERPLY